MSLRQEQDPLLSNWNSQQQRRWDRPLGTAHFCRSQVSKHKMCTSLSELNAGFQFDLARPSDDIRHWVYWELNMLVSCLLVAAWGLKRIPLRVVFVFCFRALSVNSWFALDTAHATSIVMLTSKLISFRWNSLGTSLRAWNVSSYLFRRCLPIQSLPVLQHDSRLSTFISTLLLSRKCRFAMIRADFLRARITLTDLCPCLPWFLANIRT